MRAEARAEHGRDGRPRAARDERRERNDGKGDPRRRTGAEAGADRADGEARHDELAFGADVEEAGAEPDVDRDAREE